MCRVGGLVVRRRTKGRTRHRLAAAGPTMPRNSAPRRSSGRTACPRVGTAVAAECSSPTNRHQGKGKRWHWAIGWYSSRRWPSLAGCAGSTGEPRQMARANVSTPPQRHPRPGASGGRPRPQAASRRCLGTRHRPSSGPSSTRSAGWRSRRSGIMGCPRPRSRRWRSRNRATAGRPWRSTPTTFWPGNTRRLPLRADANSWVLDCGATKDRYIVFPDRAQAVDFVARQLATSDNYADATDRYRQERAQGVLPSRRSIAGSTTSPTRTPRSPSLSGGDQAGHEQPVHPSDRRSPNDNLYRLSEWSRRLGAARPPVEPGRRAPRDAAATQEGVGELPATLPHACRTWHVARHTLRDGYITAGKWHEVPHVRARPHLLRPCGCRRRCCSGPARTR